MTPEELGSLADVPELVAVEVTEGSVPDIEPVADDDDDDVVALVDNSVSPLGSSAGSVEQPANPNARAMI